jgi:hypothetical protein
MNVNGRLEADLMNLSWTKERTDFPFKQALLGGSDIGDSVFPISSHFVICYHALTHPAQNGEHRMLQLFYVVQRGRRM